MSSSWQPYVLKLKNITLFLDRLCEVNPSFTADKIEHEFAENRNKVIVVTHLFLIFLCFVDLTFNNGPFLGTLFRIFLDVVIILLVPISGRYHPQVFNAFYSVICLIYGPCLINTGNEGIHTAFLGVHYVPLFIYLFTGSFRYFLFHIIVQTIYLNRLYIKPMERSVTYMRPEEFTKALATSSNLNIMLIATLVLITDYFTHQASQRILASEEKRDEYESQKTFLLGFSHELRNLINSLTGNVKLAGFEEMTDKAREFLKNAEVCGELLLHLIINILDTGKVEIGELEVNPTPTRTYETFEKIWGVCSELVSRKNLVGRMRIKRDLPRLILIDHYRLSQIFLNIVENAIKFTEKGSVDINVDWLDDMEQVTEKCFAPYPWNEDDDQDEGLYEKQQTFSVFDNNRLILTTVSRKIDFTTLDRPVYGKRGVLKITISDSGCGMSREEISRLFQKFIQVTSDLSKKKLGTGLGLFVTKKLCQKMRGEIRVYSKKGVGSSFVFCIPIECLHELNDSTQSQESIKDFFCIRRTRGLVVDDVTLSHFILKNFLEKLGISADVAVNGLEAYHKYSDSVAIGGNFQIVTMDIEMPVMDGKEASRRIRELEVRKGIDPCFLIIISANCSESEMRECLDKQGLIRADAFLKKPVKIEELVRMFEGNLDRFQKICKGSFKIK